MGPSLLVQSAVELELGLVNDLAVGEDHQLLA